MRWGCEKYNYLRGNCFIAEWVVVRAREIGLIDFLFPATHEGVLGGTVPPVNQVVALKRGGDRKFYSKFAIGPIDPTPSRSVAAGKEGDSPFPSLFYFSSRVS